MPSTITFASVTWDVYDTAAAVKGYLLSSPAYAATWSAASSDDQKRAQIAATRVLDRQHWLGSPTEPISKVDPQPAGTQPLAWPRSGITDREGAAVADSVIPQDVLYAYAEIVGALLASSEFENQPSSGSNLKRDRLRQKVDVVEEETEKEYFSATLRSATRWPTAIQELLGPFLDHQIGGGAFAFGTSVESAFTTERTDWGFTGGGLY